MKKQIEILCIFDVDLPDNLDERALSIKDIGGPKVPWQEAVRQCLDKILVKGMEDQPNMKFIMSTTEYGDNFDPSFTRHTVYREPTKRITIWRCKGKDKHQIKELIDDIQQGKLKIIEFDQEEEVSDSNL